MAAFRARSPLASVLALVLGAVLACHLAGVAFLPAPTAVSRAQGAVVAAALAAAAAVPEPALAIRGGDDDEGFDVRIIAVLALPLLAIGWALFNVWRVAFRQVVRIGESTKGNAK
eukprot:gb/GFBE01061612.1/.p1 GENE.gb/GFBE01061612.1/~~gb/GFBE01061612.1/.p1  ORF type:complete len:115 (+),score=27.13 gb/GFBE01061612.1/:1-345(+)